MYIYTYMYICTYTRIFTFPDNTYTCMHIHRYVCMYRLHVFSLRVFSLHNTNTQLHYTTFLKCQKLCPTLVRSSGRAAASDYPPPRAPGEYSAWSRRLDWICFKQNWDSIRVDSTRTRNKNIWKFTSTNWLNVTMTTSKIKLTQFLSITDQKKFEFSDTLRLDSSGKRFNLFFLGHVE